MICCKKKNKSVSICQASADIPETNFGGPASSKERKVIHFTSGETLEVEEGKEEEEQSSSRTPFEEPQQKVGICLKEKKTCVGCLTAATSRACICLFFSDQLPIQERGHSSWEVFTAGYGAVNTKTTECHKCNHLCTFY